MIRKGAPGAVAGANRPRSRGRGLLVVLLLTGAVLVALPALAGGLPGWVGERVELTFEVVDPGVDVPAAGTPGAPATRARTDPSPAVGEAGTGPAPADPAPDPGDDRDRDDDSSSSGSGSGGGDDSGGGGSSGPG